METTGLIIKALRACRFSASNEKQCQNEIFKALTTIDVKIEKEFRLSDSSIIDFFVDPVGIEVKIKGSSMEIYRQCERYCQFKNIGHLILLTNKAMTMPPEINSKPVTVINMGHAWL